MSDARELAGRRALVTGGSKGIGKAVATRLRDLGATLLTAARRPPDDAASGELFVAADLATAAGCRAVADAVADRLGRATSSCTSSEARRRRRADLPCSMTRSGSAHSP